LTQALRDQAKRTIAGPVAFLVVDAFQVIDIDDEEGQRPCCIARAVERHAAKRTHTIGVREPRARVQACACEQTIFFLAENSTKEHEQDRSSIEPGTHTPWPPI